MPESLPFRTWLGNLQIHGSKTLTKSASRHFYPNFPLIKDKKTSLLVRSETLGLFGNTLTSDQMNSPHNRVKFPQQVQMPLSSKQKKFLNFFFHF